MKALDWLETIPRAAAMIGNTLTVTLVVLILLLHVAAGWSWPVALIPLWLLGLASLAVIVLLAVKGKPSAP